jgi:hypothetical protein
MVSYFEWNKALADAIFSYDKNQVPVYLDLDENALEALEQHEGVELEELLNQIAASTIATFGVKGKFFDTILSDLKIWHQKYSETPDANEPPPVIPFLLLSSAAAERMGEDGVNQSNYYVHLRQILNIPDSDNLAFQNSFREVIESAFRSLNYWLEGIDGLRGRPTATSISHNAYVGLPLSQALIRSGDRAALYSFLARKKVPPGTRYNSEQISALTDIWLSNPNNDFTSSFKNLIKSEKYRNKMLELIAEEIVNWDGRRPDENPHSSSGPSVIEAFLTARWSREILSSVFNLNLLAPNNISESEQEFKFLDPNGDSHIFVVERAGQTFNRLRGDVGFDSRAMLETNLRFDGQNQFIQRKPRPIVIFTFDSEMGVFREQSVVQIGRRSMLLVRDTRNLVDEIHSYLAENARPDFTEKVKQTHSSIPDGWVLFDDLELVKSPDSNSELAKKFPELVSDETLVFHLEGGIRVIGAGRTYLLSSLPELSAISQMVLMKFRLYKSETRIAEWQTQARPERENMAQRISEPGTYRIELFLGISATAVSSIGFNVIGMDSVNPGRTFLTKKIAYDSKVQGPISLLGGMEVSDPNTPKYRDHGLTSDAEIFVSAIPYKRSASSRKYIENKIDSSPQNANCVERGAHLWILETAGPKLKDSLGQCENCGQERKFLARLHNDALKSVVVKQVLDKPSESFYYDPKYVPSLVAYEPKAINYSDLENVFHYLKFGARRNLELICREFGEELGIPWRAIAANAFEMGIIDVTCDEYGAYTSWVSGSKLPGFDSSLSFEILRSVENLSTFGESLPVSEVSGGSHLEKFDYSTLSWNKIDSMDSAGAFRLRSQMGNQYFWKQTQGFDGNLGRRSTPQVVKWLATPNDLELFSYNASSSKIVVPLGFGLPGLLGRAVYASSGAMSEIVQDKNDTYEQYSNVSPELAAEIKRKLSS